VERVEYACCCMDIVIIGFAAEYSIAGVTLRS
jgi:hypothetical protein